MLRYCKRCGASLTEGARFCRKCGAATGALKPAAPQETPEPTRRMHPIEAPTRAPGGTFEPTMPLHHTEPMTEQLMNEGTAAAPARPAARPPRARRAPILAAAGVLIVAAGISLYFGFLRPSEQPPTVHQAPATVGQPSVTVEQSGTPPVTSTPSPPPGTKAPGGRAQPPRPPAISPAKAQRLAEQYLKQGTEYLNAQRYQEALEQYQRVRRLDPSNKDVLFLMGMAYEQLGRLESALHAHQQCTSGIYAGQAERHVKILEKKLRRSK